MEDGTSLSRLLSLTHVLKPQLLVSDQGSAFMSHYFADFLDQMGISHRPAATYTPQQNSFIERFWGVRFATARAFLAAANLGPAFHVYALQTANWVWNRLPLSSRGNLSAMFILTRQHASIQFLRCFGCLVRVLVPEARREGDRHFADRGRLGIYLGPSEVSPAANVYVPASRSFITSRHVLFYEDIFPGVRGVPDTWPPSPGQEGGVAADSSSSLSERTATPSPAVSGDANTSADVSEGADTSNGVSGAEVHEEYTVPSTANVETDTVGSNANDGSEESIKTKPRRPCGTPGCDLPFGHLGPHTNEELSLTSTDQSSPDDHPSSRTRFSRRGMVSALLRSMLTFSPIDPIAMTQQSAARHAALRSLVSGARPAFLFESKITGDAARAFAVVSTADLGDVPIPNGYRQAVSDATYGQYWRQSICNEYNGLIALDTWDVVSIDEMPKGANLMNCHCIFTVKRRSDGTIEKFKCRLVAAGNTQRFGIDFDRVFSTVVKVTTIRLVLIVAAANDYNLSSIDIRQAFLQADLSDQDLYMRMPPGLPSDKGRLVCKLKRSLYGLRQAGREWNKVFVAYLISWGFVQSTVDVCLFTYSAGSSILWLLVWVDDTIIVDNDTTLRSRFVEAISERFPTEDKGVLEWVLGVKVTRDRSLRSITLSQELYVKDLVERYAAYLPAVAKSYDSPMDDKVDLSPSQMPDPSSREHEAMAPFREIYMQLVGAFLWLANMTYPEIAYAASQLGRFTSNPGKVHYAAAVRVLLYLHGKPRSLHFAPKPTSPLVVYVDSNWVTTYSVSGAIFYYMGCPFAWLAKTQRSVSLSSAEAEYYALMVAAREALHYREVLEDIGLAVSGPTTINTDNHAVVDLSLDPIAFKKTKHIMRAAHFIRDLVARRFFVVVHIAGKDNVADILTKAQSRAVFLHLMALLMRP